MMFLTIFLTMHVLGVSDSVASALWGFAAIVVAAAITGVFASRTTSMVSRIEAKKANTLDVEALQREAHRQAERADLLQDRCDRLQARLDEALSREGAMSVDLDIKTRQIATLHESVSALRKQLAKENGA